MCILQRCLLLIFLAIFSFPLMGQGVSYVGLWEGVLHLGNDSLRIVMVVDKQEDTISVVLDSPDQYVTDIPVTEFRASGDTLLFAVKSLGCSYRGIRTGDSIVGKFRQNGMKMPLTLRPVQHRQLFPRPQEPHAPYPYMLSELTFPYNEWFSISGYSMCLGCGCCSIRSSWCPCWRRVQRRGWCLVR